MFTIMFYAIWTFAVGFYCASISKAIAAAYLFHWLFLVLIGMSTDPWGNAIDWLTFDILMPLAFILCAFASGAIVWGYGIPSICHIKRRIPAMATMNMMSCEIIPPNPGSAVIHGVSNALLVGSDEFTVPGELETINVDYVRPVRAMAIIILFSAPPLLFELYLVGRIFTGIIVFLLELFALVMTYWLVRARRKLVEGKPPTRLPLYPMGSIYGPDVSRRIVIIFAVHVLIVVILAWILTTWGPTMLLWQIIALIALSVVEILFGILYGVVSTRCHLSQRIMPW